MEPHLYSGELRDWPSIQSRFGIRIPKPAFLHTIVTSQRNEHLALVVYSHDGHTFSALAALQEADDGHEEILRPLRNCCWGDIDEKLEVMSPLASPYLRELNRWISHIRPPRTPNLISIWGSDTQVVQLLRNALGLHGARLKRAVGRAAIMPVAPSDYYALMYWAKRYPQVTISSAFFDELT